MLKVPFRLLLLSCAVSGCTGEATPLHNMPSPTQDASVEPQSNAADGSSGAQDGSLEVPCGRMAAGTSLRPGERLLSCNGKIELRHQQNGNVALYYTPNGYPMWNTGSKGKSTSELALQSNGALTLLSGDHAVVWSNGVDDLSNPWLQLENDGDLVVWESEPGVGRAAWSTKTAFCPRPKERFAKKSLRGKYLNDYTDDLLKCAEAELGFSFQIVQGSFNMTVSASAGTHDGGGVIDIRLKDCDSCKFFSMEKTDRMVGALRRAGFAAWRRGTWDSFAPHIHAVAIGDKSVAPVAASQVVQYFAGTDGLAARSHDRELDRVGRPIPPWAADFR